MFNRPSFLFSRKPVQLLIGFSYVLCVLCAAQEPVRPETANELSWRIIESEKYDGQLFDALGRFPPAERNTALVEVLLHGNAERSVDAAILLIHADAVETAPTIAKHIVTQFDERQLQILGRLGSLDRIHDPWLCIPRAVLAALPQRAGRDPILGKARSPKLGKADPLGFAALLLANSNAQDDHRLVRLALPYESRSSWMLWAACTKLGLHDAALRELATDVMQDRSQSQFIPRIAAAIAVASVDKDALELVIAEVTAIIARERDQNLESMISAMMSRGTSQEGWDAFLQFGKDLQALGLLQFLNDDRTQDLLVEALSAKNSQLAMTAAFTLLRRSPDLLVRCELSSFSDDDYAVLMAVAKVADPSLSFPTRGAGLAAKIKAANNRLESLGSDQAFGIAGRSVFGL